MKNKKIFIVFLCLFFNLSQGLADERKNKLDKLFKELKNSNPELTFKVEQKIWKIWSSHPKENKLTLIKSREMLMNWINLVTMHTYRAHKEIKILVKLPLPIQFGLRKKVVEK